MAVRKWKESAAKTTLVEKDVFSAYLVAKIDPHVLASWVKKIIG